MKHKKILKKLPIKSTTSEFLDFLKEQKVISLAIAFIIGGAAKDLVTSTVNNLIMPSIGIITPSGSWREISFEILNSNFAVGQFLGSLVDFVIIALLIFFVTKKLLKNDKS